ncbi:MAG: SIR2 family protein [Candidatus Dormibacteria bacterium]
MLDFPRMAPILAQLQDIAESGSIPIEQFLQEYSDSAAHQPHRFPILAATQYFLQSAISQCADTWYKIAATATNYSELLDAVEAWRRSRNELVIIATFNYDQLIERALSDTLGIRFGTPDEYIQRDDYRLIKLHGSVNWGRRISGHLFGLSGPGCRTYLSNRSYLSVLNEIIDQMPDVDITTDVTLTDQMIDAETGAIHFPAIALPTITKGALACPESQATAFRQVLPSVDRILIVGWRGADAHVIDVLRAKLEFAVPLQIVNGSSVEDARALASRIRVMPPGSRAMPPLCPGMGFSQYLASGGYRGFLA